jgi:FixJ family two-component response regulator
VLSTGFSEIIDGERARKIGVKEFLMKPILKADLAASVRRALDRG